MHESARIAAFAVYRMNVSLLTWHICGTHSVLCGDTNYRLNILPCALINSLIRRRKKKRRIRNRGEPVKVAATQNGGWLRPSAFANRIDVHVARAWAFVKFECSCIWNVAFSKVSHIENVQPKWKSAVWAKGDCYGDVFECMSVTWSECISFATRRNRFQSRE